MAPTLHRLDGHGRPPASESFFGIVLVKFPHVVNGLRAMCSDVSRGGKPIARNATRDGQGAAAQRSAEDLRYTGTAPRPAASTAYAMHRASKVARQSQRWM